MRILKNIKKKIIDYLITFNYWIEYKAKHGAMITLLLGWSLIIINGLILYYLISDLTIITGNDPDKITGNRIFFSLMLSIVLMIIQGSIIFYYALPANNYLFAIERAKQFIDKHTQYANKLLRAIETTKLSQDPRFLNNLVDSYIKIIRLENEQKNLLSRQKSIPHELQKINEEITLYKRKLKIQ